MFTEGYYVPSVCYSSGFMCPCQGIFPTVLQIICHRSMLHMSKLRVEGLCLLGATERSQVGQGFKVGSDASGLFSTIFHHLYYVLTNYKMGDVTYYNSSVIHPLIQVLYLVASTLCHALQSGLRDSAIQRVQHLKIQPTSDG